MPARNPSFTVADDVEVPSPSPGELWTVGAVILNCAGEAFAQKRSLDRRLFPDTWDIVGGHVEAGESLLEALAREIEEETGWRLRHVRQFLGTMTWTGDDGAGLRHEADYLVEVDGELDNPALEWSKHSAYAWFGPDGLGRLKENCTTGEFLIHDLIARASHLASLSPPRPMSTATTGHEAPACRSDQCWPVPPITG
ncbi:NUDIX domain-containing protein [Streptomyces sp. NPDC001815]|uniref:NUDIX hydrolase n=1 Tax=Streptomyces sp. NPDC001815 TaxID=3154526 RepID=UPI003331910C